MKRTHKCVIRRVVFVFLIEMSRQRSIYFLYIFWLRRRRIGAANKSGTMEMKGE
jgi:hypothetical protein